MMVRFLDNGDLELCNMDGISTKFVRAGHSYPVLKVLMCKETQMSDIYFKEGCAEDVDNSLFELCGPLDSLEYKKAPKVDNDE